MMNGMSLLGTFETIMLTIPPVYLFFPLNLITRRRRYSQYKIKK